MRAKVSGRKVRMQSPQNNLKEAMLRRVDLKKSPMMKPNGIWPMKPMAIQPTTGSMVNYKKFAHQRKREK